MNHIYRNRSLALLTLALTLLLIGCKAKPEAPAEPDPDILYRPTAHSLLSVRSDDSDHYAIIVDYSIPSNKPRFFVWDYRQDKIILQLWCAHGFGGGSTAEKPVFSNTYGSNCSSLGVFLIEKGLGTSATYGYKYHALDGYSSTNSNARQRQLLLHYWGSVERDSIAGITTPMACDMRSAGCFTLSPSGFRSVSRIIRSEDKRIMLYAIDGIE